MDADDNEEASAGSGSAISPLLRPVAESAVSNSAERTVTSTGGLFPRTLVVILLLFAILIAPLVPTLLDAVRGGDGCVSVNSKQSPGGASGVSVNSQQSQGVVIGSELAAAPTQQQQRVLDRPWTAPSSSRYLTFSRFGRLSNGYIQLGHMLYLGYHLNRTVVTPDTEPLHHILNFTVINRTFGRQLVISTDDFLVQEGLQPHSSRFKAYSCVRVPHAVCLKPAWQCPAGCKRQFSFYTDTHTEYSRAKTVQELQNETAPSADVSLLFASSMYAYRLSIAHSQLEDPGYRLAMRRHNWIVYDSKASTVPYLTFTHEVWLHAVRLLLYSKAKATSATATISKELYCESEHTVTLLDAMVEGEKQRQSRLQSSMPMSHLTVPGLPEHYRYPVLGMHVRLEDKRSGVNLQRWMRRVKKQEDDFVSRLEQEHGRAGGGSTIACFIGTNGNADERAQLLDTWSRAQIECPTDDAVLFPLCSKPGSTLVAAVIQATLILVDVMGAGTTSSTFTKFIEEKRQNCLNDFRQARDAVLQALAEPRPKRQRTLP